MTDSIHTEPGSASTRVRGGPAVEPAATPLAVFVLVVVHVVAAVSVRLLGSWSTGQ